MSQALEELKRIGSLEIHKHTHIPRASIDALINEDFSKMNRIQFNGFVTILEREYLVDLSVLKKSGLSYVEEHKNETKVRTEYVPLEEKSSKLIYIVIGFVILIAAIYFTMFNTQEEAQESYETQGGIVEKVEKEISPQIKNTTLQVEQELNTTLAIMDVNTTSESNSSKIDANATDTVEVIAQIIPVETLLTITQKSRRWFGYVDLSTHKKNNRTFKGDFDLNGSKDWLLISRPGAVVFEIDDKTKKYKSTRNMRFKYIDKKLTKIRLAEWQKLNKGRVW